MRRRMPMSVLLAMAIPKMQQQSLHAAACAFMPPDDLSRESHSIGAHITWNRCDMIPTSKVSRSRSRRVEEAPEGCNQLNIITDAAVSRSPTHLGALSPRRLDGAIMHASFDDTIKVGRTSGPWSSMIASAEQEDIAPRTIPDDSRILDWGVSLFDPKDSPDDDFRISNATVQTCSSFNAARACKILLGAEALDMPSSYFPFAQAFPISPMAFTVAAKVSIAILRSSTGRFVLPTSRTIDRSAGKQLLVVRSNAASLHAPRPLGSFWQSYIWSNVLQPCGSVRRGCTSEAKNSQPILATALSADSRSCDTDEPHPPPAEMARMISPSFFFVLPMRPPLSSYNADIDSSTARVDARMAPNEAVACALVSESSDPTKLQRMMIPPVPISWSTSDVY
mmetsp:Transcript_12129/g.35169  ORF Transcript_12129/g.35169 Transcript_12129/m.35169 type:complete len:394 (+) Transcript_12129:2311-3492(+)